MGDAEVTQLLVVEGANARRVDKAGFTAHQMAQTFTSPIDHV
jgi:hypothetical protein